jgi:hypothetical protein
VFLSINSSIKIKNSSISIKNSSRKIKNNSIKKYIYYFYLVAEKIVAEE